MNALHLVDPKNAWIVKPLDRVEINVSCTRFINSLTNSHKGVEKHP